jgi:phenylacetate-coenzyme A ligase PaaK-like adenylate-forming protein
MQFDFSKLPLKNRAFSEKPMTFIDRGAKDFLAAMIDLIAIETGNRAAREYWQHKQLQNLLQHAAQRSAFWRKRIGSEKIKDISLPDLPILTRGDVVKQVETEGSLLPPGGPIATNKHSTSGSSGTPVQFFASEMNTHYNGVRSIAQYFIEGRDLTLNRTRLRGRYFTKHGFTVKKTESWLGSLGSFIRSGINKHIEYFHPNIDLLRKELECDSIGYLIAPPRIVEMMLQSIDAAILKHAGMVMWAPLSEPVDPKLRETFDSLNIPVRATYSSEEVGMIGSECERVPGNYHVATSNVIIEVSKDDPINLGDKQLGRVLVTHLHSYATPFIRYDVGDVACLADRCFCGHNGPTLSDVYGRSKALLKHADGRLSTFYIPDRVLRNVSQFDEYRIRQTDVKTIVVEIGGRQSLSADEIAAFVNLIKQRAGDDFEVRVGPVAKIEWGHSIKRLGFHSEVLR